MRRRNHRTPQQRRAVMYVASVRQTHQTWSRQAFSCRLKVCSVISGLRGAAGRLFHGDGPATAQLRWLIVVRALGTCSRG